MKKHPIILKKVNVHNLKNVDLEIQSNELIAFTGVSGSGKSSLAFDTIYVEGQRRYIESLSTFARRYLGDMTKPDVEYVSGLSPSIAIEQKSSSKNPRSTVGTMTEIYDYLRVLYARVATPHCPVSGEAVSSQSRERIIKTIQLLPIDSKIILLAPFARGKKGEFKDDFAAFLRKGYTRLKIDGSFVDISEEISLDKNLSHDIDIVVDRCVVNPDNFSRLAEAVTNALNLGSGVMSVVNLTLEEEILFSTMAFSPKSGLSYTSLEPGDFSFNSPSGMCPTCLGLGRVQEFDFDLIIDSSKSIAEDCCTIASSYYTVRYGNIYNNLAELYGFDVHTPWKDLSEKAKQVWLYGTQKKWTQMHFVHPERDLGWTEYVQWRGIIYEAKERYAQAKSDLYRQKVESLMKEQICPACQGARLKPYPAAATLNKKNISSLTKMTIQETLDFIASLKLDPKEELIADELIKEILKRLYFLIDVGLHYLSLERTAPTLSGGESQRVRLASQVGSGLVGVTYILDEPSIGLHPRDNEKLIATLKKLRDVGNTVIVVEHDRDTMLSADRIVDFGPGPGVQGGEILVNGSLKDVVNNKRSLTGAFLSGRNEISIPQKRRSVTKNASIEIVGASHNNLKKIDVTFPLGVFIAVTGVSGSGKSSLIADTLHPALANALNGAEMRVGAHTKIIGLEHLDKVIAIDQSPIGRNPRSNPATYIKIFDEIRALFSKLPESVARGYQVGRFSFNAKGGACQECRGMGMLKIDMDFMEDAWVVCGNCKQKRFDSETLSIYYKGKNIYDVLEMSVTEALDFFKAIPQLKKKLEVIEEVGMGYIKLGQPSTTLSGGEAQRIKLAKELVRTATGNTFYILDEPTTGLHFHDIKALLSVLQELVERGNTVLVIEHNMDVVKTADWIIDLGVDGGALGGQITETGTPEKIAKMKTPTGVALHDALNEKKISFKKREKNEEVAAIEHITVLGAEQNNLKAIDLKIERGKMTVCTGPSGSGKSSLAFDTIYAEGQRRYIESLSPYARQFVQQMPKPKAAQIEGLSPAIAIEQKATAGNPRSTVGTMTEIYDYLRILFAQAGSAFCPETGEPIESITKEVVVEKILQLPEDEKVVILSPLHLEKQDKFEEVVHRLRSLGFLRLRLNGALFELDSDIAFDRKRKNEMALVIDRLRLAKSNEHRLFEAIEKAVEMSKGKVIVMRESGEDLLFNLAFAVVKTGKSYPTITPHTFSFNSPLGMCLECLGLGVQYGANLAENEHILNLTFEGLTHTLFTTPAFELFREFMKKEGINAKTALKDLDPKKLHLILNGSERLFPSKEGFTWRWLGLQPIFEKLARIGHGSIKEALIPMLDEMDCSACLGTRLNPLARNVRIEHHSITSLCHIPIIKTLAFIETITLPKQKQKLLEEVLVQIKSKLHFLLQVGLHYLSLDRKAPTLSNGEAQRIRLARQLGSSLTGVLYVLDEPTIGLHPKDTARLNEALIQLKNLGNTLLLVEHDLETVSHADYVVDFGPGSGSEGGHIVAQGTFKEILKNPNSLTGSYLAGKKQIPSPNKRRVSTKSWRIEHALKNNLKDLSFDIPLGIITVFTGISGSGKSTLMHDVIKPLAQAGLKKQEPFDKLIVIDQDPIGHTVRSDVGTYVEVLGYLRDFYSSLGLARAKGLMPGHFSYNHRKGMCTHCFGLGYKKVEMLFLPTVKVTCDECKGLRLNPISLEVHYEGKNFGHLLEMTVIEARKQFELLAKAKRVFDTLIETGLGYLKLGQEMATLSGGEAQRMKLSRELSKKGTKKTLYLLDEPTTGLHPDDIAKLLGLLHRLVDKGNTMMIIEHNLDIMKNADYIFDLGPDAGVEGGYIVAQGTPEEVAKHPNSYTAAYLKKSL